jgi:alpha-pyrone synthase
MVNNIQTNILAIDIFEAPHRVTRTEYLEFQYENIPEWTEAFSRLVTHTGVETRQTYLPEWQEYFRNKTHSTEERNESYNNIVFPELIKNLEFFIEEHAIDKDSIGGIVTVSCTGISNPTLDTKIIGHLALTSCLHWHLGYMGCHGGIIGMQSGAALCALVPEKIVLVICVEACSLHYQKLLDPGIQISNALFSDGLAIIAMQKSSYPKDKDQLVGVLDSVTTNTFPVGSNYLTWNMTDFGWLMGLSPKLPLLISQTLQNSFFQQYRGNKNLIVHPGGKSILKAVQDGLDLEPILASYTILKNFGNMSSPSIFFCFKEFLRLHSLKNEEATLIAFGPGLDVSTATILF